MSAAPRQVETLNAADIGSVIRLYDWDAGRETGQVITTELRQIVHYANRTTLICDATASQEHTLQHGEIVILDPASDYSDVRELVAAFAVFHGYRLEDAAMMTKARLMHTLGRIQGEYERTGDGERAHGEADRALLDYIGDPDITDAYTAARPGGSA